MSSKCALIAALGLCCGMASAFEPGSEKVCVPSANGRSFECRDKATGAVEAPAPARTPAPVAATNPAPATVSSPPPSQPDSQPPAADKLPSYLLMQPAAPSRPASAATPAPATQAKPAAPAPPVEPITTAAPPAEPEQATAVSMPAPKPEPAQDSIEGAAAVPPARPSEAEAPTAATPVAAPSPAPAAPSAPAEPSNGPARVEAQQRPAVAEAPEPTAAATVLGPGEFRQLDPAHYTLVLASQRDAVALDALAARLGDLSGHLYLIRLDMPDGAWFSLCWSDFADLDAARAARASLPADPDIESGWPRRIGLLQNELAH